MEFLFHSKRLYSAINFTALQHTKVKKGWSYPVHHHTSVEFIFCLKGVLLQNIGDEIFPLTSGDSMIIRSNTYHSTTALKDSEFLGFHFDIEDAMISSIFQNSKQSVISELDVDYYQRINDITRSFVSNYHHWFEQQDQFEKLTPTEKFEFSITKLQIHSHLLELIFVVSSIYFKEYQERRRVGVNDTKIAESIATILQQHTCENYRIQDLCEELHLNRTHISKTFTKVYGISPKSYHSSLRVKEAKQKLLENEKSITEIAYDLGFSSAAHFTKFFTIHSHISPSEYRNRQYKNES